jgi:hypothetical protein
VRRHLVVRMQQINGVLSQMVVTENKLNRNFVEPSLYTIQSTILVVSMDATNTNVPLLRTNLTVQSTIKCCNSSCT